LALPSLFLPSAGLRARQESKLSDKPLSCLVGFEVDVGESAGELAVAAQCFIVASRRW